MPANHLTPAEVTAFVTAMHDADPAYFNPGDIIKEGCRAVAALRAAPKGQNVMLRADGTTGTTLADPAPEPLTEAWMRRECERFGLVACGGGNESCYTPDGLFASYPWVQVHRAAVACGGIASAGAPYVELTTRAAVTAFLSANTVYDAASRERMVKAHGGWEPQSDPSGMNPGRYVPRGQTKIYPCVYPVRDLAKNLNIVAYDENNKGRELPTPAAWLAFLDEHGAKPTLKVNSAATTYALAVANDTDPDCPVWKARRYTSPHVAGEHRAAFIDGRWREPVAAKNGFQEWCAPRYQIGDKMWGTTGDINASNQAAIYNPIVPMTLAPAPVEGREAESLGKAAARKLVGLGEKAGPSLPPEKAVEHLAALAIGRYGYTVFEPADAAFVVNHIAARDAEIKALKADRDANAAALKSALLDLAHARQFPSAPAMMALKADAAAIVGMCDRHGWALEGWHTPGQCPGHTAEWWATANESRYRIGVRDKSGTGMSYYYGRTVAAAFASACAAESEHVANVNGEPVAEFRRKLAAEGGK